MDEPVLVALDGPVLKVTLNRPDKLNSFNEAMHAALRAAVDRMEREPEVRAARTMSQASARLAPAPAATPLTAQTMGFSSARSRRIRGLYQAWTVAPRSSS